MLRKPAALVMTALSRGRPEMCIGIPMQALQTGPGHALVRGRGDTRQVNTHLVLSLIHI